MTKSPELPQQGREDADEPLAPELFDRANQFAKENRLEEAVQMYERLVDRLDEAGDKATVLLAAMSCLIDLGLLKEARHKLHDASELIQENSPNRPHIELGEVEVLVSEGNRREALRTVEELLSNRARLFQAEKGYALYQRTQVWHLSILVDLRRYKQAAPILEEVLTLEIDDISVPFYAGRCNFGLGDYVRAKRYLEEALQLGLPPAWECVARACLGAIYYYDGALAKAKLEHERAEFLELQIGASVKDKRNTYLWLAKICRELDQNDEAARYERLARETTK